MCMGFCDPLLPSDTCTSNGTNFVSPVGRLVESTSCSSSSAGSAPVVANMKNNNTAKTWAVPASLTNGHAMCGMCPSRVPPPNNKKGEQGRAQTPTYLWVQKSSSSAAQLTLKRSSISRSCPYQWPVPVVRNSTHRPGRKT